MRKLLRLSLISALTLTALLAFSPAAWATPNKISPDGAAAQYSTDIGGATVVITNNYGISDVVEIVLDAAPVAANVVYWVYLPGPTDKTAQLGTITIKKGAQTGKLSIAAGKLSDFTAGSVNVVTGSSMDACEYGEVAKTTPATGSNVTLRNSPSGAEMLIVPGSVVKKGMNAYAIVNGKIYKATAKADNVDLQVSLAANMEVGTPVWFTVAAAGCMEVDYRKLELGTVATSGSLAAGSIKLFFQGNGSATSSLMVFGVSPGDKIRCYTAGGVNKTVPVPSGATMVTITSLKLYDNDVVNVAITKAGQLESTPITVTALPSQVATAAPKSASAINTIDVGAAITVKNVMVGDTVYIYDAQGLPLANKTAVIPAPVDPEDPEEEDPLAVDVVFELNLGPLATTVYVSVESADADRGESTWLAVKVPVAKN